MISQVPQQRSSTSQKSLASMHSIGRLHSFSSEADGDPIKVKMTPRVAVRDKTPHRFQVVPLRETSQRPIDGANALALPNFRHSQNRLRGKVGPSNMSSSSRSTPSPSLVGNAHLQFIESKTHASHLCWIRSLQASSSKRIYNDTSSLARQPLTELDQNVEPSEPSELYLEDATSKPKRPQIHSSSLKSFPNQATLLLPSTSLSASSLSSQSVEHRRQDVHTKSSSFIPINQLASPRSHLEDRTPRPVRKQTMTFSENLYNGRSEYVSEGNVKPMIKHLETAGRPSSKRNAIYNQPLYTDFLKQTDVPRLVEDSHKGVTDVTADFAALHERQESTCPQPPPVHGERLHKRSLDVGEEDPENIDTIISPSASHQYAMENALLKSLLPTLLPTQPLRCSRTHSVCAKPFSEGKVVYSSIVLELMSDIDKALEGWKN